MNSIEHLFWIAAACLLIQIFGKPGPTYLWLWFGVLMGLGFQNKISMLFLGMGLFAGMILSPARKHLLDWRPWASAGIALVLMSPYLIWQVQNDFPTVEFMSRASELKNAEKSIVQFLGDFIVIAHPFNTPLWLAGLLAFLLRREWMNYRPLAWIFIAPMILFLVQNGKSYYLAGALPLLLAAGSVEIARWMETGFARSLKPVVLGILVFGGCLSIPLSVPILTPETYVRYSNLLGVSAPQDERGPVKPLPQIFADRLGWEAMSDQVESIFMDLDPEERQNCLILTHNYGEAAALEYHSPGRQLPRVVSTHNNYFLWGLGDTAANILISVGFSSDQLAPHFGSVTAAGALEIPFAQESGAAYFVCRDPRKPLEELFRGAKNFI